MKILWLTNKVIPYLDILRGRRNLLVNEGWLSQMFAQLIELDDFDMNLICMGDMINDSGISQKLNWWTIKTGMHEENIYTDLIYSKFLTILKKVEPDVIHIWGSEYPHSLAMVNAAQDAGYLNRTVLSLQGIMYLYAHHYLASIPYSQMNSRTIYDILRRNSLLEQQRRFEKRGQYEIEAFKKLKHVIGRTEWDRYAVSRINSSVKYWFCNETLRENFYYDEWVYNKCNKHSIFISQASYPIKGFHEFLLALPALVKKYPDLHVNIAGPDVTKTNTLLDKLKMGGYGKYLRTIINKHNLEKHLSFLGRIDANEMKRQYLLSNVFVSASSIENSPNSVGEAMLLGCPIVCSDVGGVSSIFYNGIDGFSYPFDEFYMIEKHISQIFDDRELAEKMGRMARKHALKTHDSQNNFTQLIKIYKNIENASNEFLK